jgi:hypothetical protein
MKQFAFNSSSFSVKPRGCVAMERQPLGSAYDNEFLLRVSLFRRCPWQTHVHTHTHTHTHTNTHIHTRNNIHNTQICTTALFIYSGSYMFRQWSAILRELLDPSELRENTYRYGCLSYNVVKWPVCRIVVVQYKLCRYEYTI